MNAPESSRHRGIAGRIAAQALVAAEEFVKPGVTTDEVDRVVHEFLCDHGAYPSTLGYKGYPKSCCTSPAAWASPPQTWSKSTTKEP